MQTNLATAIGWVIVAFIAGLALTILVLIWTGKIDVVGLLAEQTDTPGASPKASMSRLQLLIFTFVIAGLYLTLCLEAGDFIAIPNQVLGLLGISGGSFILSKGIQANKDKRQP
jgi:hypothetical protein